MKPVRFARLGRPRAGAMMIGIGVAAAALTAGPALAASASTQTAPAVQGRLKSQRIAFDHPVVITGVLPATDAGHTLALQFLAAGARSWQALATTTAAAGGRYRVSAPLRRSGLVRVVDLSAAASAPAASAPAAVAHDALASPYAQHVAVAAAVRVRRQSFASLGGGPVTVRGRLLPGVAHRVVRLQGLSGGAWRTLAVTRTGADGRFSLTFTPADGRERIRVRFAGDRLNARAGAPAGTVTGYQASVASWYYDGGSTACGFHAYYGVANKSLPCGTQVNFVVGGRSVTATVDDRGPYVGGRTWDLNQNTAAALGFGGVGVVWYAY